jgi:hypothetical protein
MVGLAVYTRFGSLDWFGQLEDGRGSSRGSGLIPSDWFGFGFVWSSALPRVTLGLPLVCSLLPYTIRSFSRPLAHMLLSHTVQWYIFRSPYLSPAPV